MTKTAKKPNIILMLTDDQGWGDLSYTGNTDISTTNVDKLAQDGAIFDSFYVQPLCAPTRAEILTGRYFARTGVRGVTRRQEIINLDETTMGDVFKTAGYATGCFGKWHSGSAYPYHPNGRGFDEFYGFCCGHWSHYFNSTIEHNGEEITGNGYIVDDLTDKALDFIDLNKDEPFLCYIPFITPHQPFQIGDEWFDKFADKKINQDHRYKDEENLTVTRCVLAMCENIDWNVGRILDKVKELNIQDDTIIIYMSDNGPNSYRWNNGMKGKKGSTDEGGVRSPFSITYPSKIKSNTRIERIASSIDILPTLLELASIDINVAKPLDGMSFAPDLRGEKVTSDRMLFSSNPRGEFISVRTQQYRACDNEDGLYDLTKDLGQNNDLSSKLPQLYDEFMGKIDDWQKEMFDEDISLRPITVGYREFPNTFLNVQDAVPTGKITWSSIHPNASYLINWDDINDTISWDIDVNISGKYDVTLMYTCPNGDEGSEIQVEHVEEKIIATIDIPFDSKVKDDRDRVKRIVSYAKEFRPMYLGQMDLSKGIGKFTLRANSIIGKEVCQLRTIKLTMV